MPNLSWNARIFVSVDLIGSTEFKVNESKKDVPDWALFFREFYTTFPESLKAAYSNLVRYKLDVADPDRLKVWKFNGDEILFVATMRRHQEALAHLLAVKFAMSAFSKEWNKKQNKYPALKGTAWFAGFPVANREIILETSQGDTSSIIRDFIGPSMDLGFRLTQFAGEREFTLSADLAFLVMTTLQGNFDPKLCKIFHKGRYLLQGVFQGEKYPVLWLDMNDGVVSAEDQLLGVNRDFQQEVMHEFLTGFLDSHAIGCRRPFIVGDADPQIGVIPVGIQSEFDKLREQIKAEESARGYQSAELPPSPEITKPGTPLDPPKTQ